MSVQFTLLMTNSSYTAIIVSVKGGCSKTIHKCKPLFKHVKSFNCHVLTPSLTDAWTKKLVASLLEILSSCLGPLFSLKYISTLSLGSWGSFPCCSMYKAQLYHVHALLDYTRVLVAHFTERGRICGQSKSQCCLGEQITSMYVATWEVTDVLHVDVQEDSDWLQQK